MRRDVSQPEGPRYGETVSFASRVCPILGQRSLSFHSSMSCQEAVICCLA